jgi:predicted transcriptional regulator
VRLKKNCIFENRRNHYQVLVDILELCEVPQAKTCVLRKTNTTFKLLENYLLQLQSAGLLEAKEETKKYSTTKEGHKFIRAWFNLNSLINPNQPNISVKKRAVVKLIEPEAN